MTKWQWSIKSQALVTNGMEQKTHAYWNGCGCRSDVSSEHTSKSDMPYLRWLLWVYTVVGCRNYVNNIDARKYLDCNSVILLETYVLKIKMTKNTIEDSKSICKEKNKGGTL